MTYLQLKEKIKTILTSQGFYTSDFTTDDTSFFVSQRRYIGFNTIVKVSKLVGHSHDNEHFIIKVSSTENARDNKKFMIRHEQSGRLIFARDL